MLTDPAGVNDLTRDIIGCAIKVHKVLGPGLLEQPRVTVTPMPLREVAGLLCASPFVSVTPW
jgi:hypothetical protein